MPPLRERGEDLILLLNYFVHQLSKQLKKKITGLTSEALSLISSYSFPGNVRELRNIIEYAVTVCQGRELDLNHLPLYVRSMDLLRPEQASPAENVIAEIQPQPVCSNWTHMERQLIMDAMVKAGGRKSKAADILGWGRSTLWRKMKKHKLD